MKVPREDNIEAESDDRPEAFSMMALLVYVSNSTAEDYLIRKRRRKAGTYRSITVMSGATKPEAHVAAVMSAVVRHGRSLVFHLVLFGGKTLVVAMLGFGERSRKGFSFNEFGRPLRSTSRVMISDHQCVPFWNACPLQ